MPNHVHCILFFLTAKGFMAYETIKRLEAKGLSKILIRLKEGLTERDAAKGQKHKVFEDSFDAKPIHSS